MSKAFFKNSKPDFEKRVYVLLGHRRKVIIIMRISTGANPGYKEGGRGGGVRVRVRYVQSTRSSYGLWGHSGTEMRYRDFQALILVASSLSSRRYSLSFRVSKSRRSLGLVSNYY